MMNLNTKSFNTDHMLLWLKNLLFKNLSYKFRIINDEGLHYLKFWFSNIPLYSDGTFILRVLEHRHCKNIVVSNYEMPDRSLTLKLKHYEDVTYIIVTGGSLKLRDEYTSIPFCRRTFKKFFKKKPDCLYVYAEF